MKTKKERLKQDCERYVELVAVNEGQVSPRDEIFEKMRAGIAAWIRSNIDYSTRAWFDKVEQTVLDSCDEVKDIQLGQGRLSFALDGNAIIALGDSMRICVRYCTREHLEQRRGIWVEQRNNICAKAEKVIAAIDAALEKMGPDDLYGDVMDA